MAGLFGLAIGSFLNVVIHRLPIILERDWQSQCHTLLNPDQPLSTASERFNLIVPRSRCPHCGHAITALENIWIVLLAQRFLREQPGKVKLAGIAVIVLGVILVGLGS